MDFKNLTCFRFDPDTAPGLDDLKNAIAKQPLRSCGPLESHTSGFVPPITGSGEPLYSDRDFAFFAVGSEDKKVPASVLRKEIRKVTDRIACEEDRLVGSAEMNRIEIDALERLLPQAFAISSTLLGYLDLQTGWVVLDTASHKAAEDALSNLRKALGSFPATPLVSEAPPRGLMTQWLSGDAALPSPLAWGDECELRDPVNEKETWRGKTVDLEGPEVQSHVDNGKQVSQLGLIFDARLLFTLGDDLTVHRLRVSSEVADKWDSQDGLSEESRQKIVFQTMALEVKQLLEHLEKWFSIAPFAAELVDREGPVKHSSHSNQLSLWKPEKMEQPVGEQA